MNRIKASLKKNRDKIIVGALASVGLAAGVYCTGRVRGELEELRSFTGYVMNGVAAGMMLQLSEDGNSITFKEAEVCTCPPKSESKAAKAAA